MVQKRGFKAIRISISSTLFATKTLSIINQFLVSGELKLGVSGAHVPTSRTGPLLLIQVHVLQFVAQGGASGC